MHTVSGFPLSARLLVLHLACDAHREARSGEFQPWHVRVRFRGDRSIVCRSMRPCPRAGLGVARDGPAAVVAELLEQLRLVALDGHDVMQSAVEDVPGGLTLGVPGVGDHATPGVAPGLQGLAQGGPPASCLAPLKPRWPTTGRS